MITLKSVEIGFSESPLISKGIYLGEDAIEKANQNCRVPFAVLGYWKTDVIIIWDEDGEKMEYKMRFDISEDNSSLFWDLFNTFRCYAGYKKPRHLTSEQYQRILDDLGEESRNFYKRYYDNFFATYFDNKTRKQKEALRIS